MPSATTGPTTASASACCRASPRCSASPDSPLAWQPDVVHANDWQSALAPAWLHYEGGAASVVTVHNIAFQGNFAADHLAALGLPAAGLDLRWRRVPRPAFLPQGRPATGDADLDGQPDLRPRDPGRGVRLRAGAAAPPPHRRPARHPQRRQQRPSGTRLPTRRWRRATPPTGWPASAPTSARCRSKWGWPSATTGRCSASSAA